MTDVDPAIAAITMQLAELSEKYSELLMKVHALERADSKKAKPKESVRWHDITDEVRHREVDRLRAWHRDILAPVLDYGLPECWPLHTSACLSVEIACEMWRTLWLSKRTQSVLTAQAEFMIRQLPGLMKHALDCCHNCEHSRPVAPQLQAVGDED